MKVTEKSQVVIEKRQPVTKVRAAPNLIPGNPAKASREKILKIKAAILNDLPYLFPEEDSIHGYVKTWIDKLQTFVPDNSKRLEFMMMLQGMIKKRIFINPFIITISELQKLNRLDFKRLVDIDTRNFSERINDAYERAMKFDETIKIDPQYEQIELDQGVTDQINLMLIKKFKLIPEMKKLFGTLAAKCVENIGKYEV